MEKKVMSKDFMEQNREEILAKYAVPAKQNAKPQLLTKKERKALGVGRDQGKAIAKYIRVSPRKMNIVINLIKGKSLDDAYAILMYTPKEASPILTKALKSAEANCVNRELGALSRDSLYVADAYANQGPVLKRFMPRARGSAARINKRTSHVTVVLKERE